MLILMWMILGWACGNACLLAIFFPLCWFGSEVEDDIADYTSF